MTIPTNPLRPEEQVWHVDARQNFYWGGPLPFFFWPRINEDLDDQQPPLRMIGFNTINYFGQQLKTDWNGFRLLGHAQAQVDRPVERRRRLPEQRTKDFPALGSEMGWYRRRPDPRLARIRIASSATPDQHFTHNYFGYFDIWGLKDAGIDVLGTGPAIVTNGPAGAGKAGFQRSADPPFQSDRGTARPSATISDSFPKTKTTPSTSCDSSSKSAMPPTETSSRNTTSGSSTPAWTRRRSPT